MVVDGGTIVATQPTPMADTTGEGPTAGIWQNMVQMMVLYGWTGKGHGIQWRRLAWKSSHTSQINCYKSDLSVKKQGFSFHICTWLCFSMWYSGLSLHMRTKCICRTGLYIDLKWKAMASENQNLNYENEPLVYFVPFFISSQDRSTGFEDVR